jgi:hypothetical protein
MRRQHFVSVDDANVRWRGRAAFIIIGTALSLLVPALAVVATAAHATGQTAVIAAGIQRFLLFYAGVFALVALTAAVGAGLVAADRVVMSPGSRVVAQALHRAISLIALSALGTHIMLEIIAHRARAVDAFVPFLAGWSAFYLGVGTISSDLFVLIVVTGIARRRFAAGSRPWAWRALHAAAYLAWPLAIVHGLLAGRAAKPYVDWSYGGCLAAAGLILAVRLVATLRRRDTAAQPVPDRAAWPLQAGLATRPYPGARSLPAAGSPAATARPGEEWR